MRFLFFHPSASQPSINFKKSKLAYRSFSLTWTAAVQICWNKRNKVFHYKRVQPSRDFLSTPTWPLFHCVDVKWKRSIDPDGISLIRSFKTKACRGNVQLDKWREGRCGGLGYAWNSYWLIHIHTAGFFKSKFRWCATRSWLSTVVVCRFTVYICILGLL